MAELKQNEYVDVEVDGYTAKCNINCLDDVEMLPLMDELTSGKRAGAVNELLKAMLGEDGYKAFTDHFRAKYGRTPINLATELISKAQSKLDPKE